MPFGPFIKRELIKILGSQWVKDDSVTLYAYRCDSLTLHPSEPMGVVFPDNSESIIALVKLFKINNISYLPRGAGTGLSGGAVPESGSVIIEMVRMNKILEIDFINRIICVEPAVVNLRITEQVQKKGYQYVPDPSSQKACTIGGNVAENAGGPHTLKYGVTVNHIVGMEVVLPNGDLVELGADFFGIPGPDLLGLFIGSEGTFGIVTKIKCRLTPIPEKVITMYAIYDRVKGACETVSQTIRSGIVPAAMEMLDKVVLDAVERAMQPGFPKGAEAILIVEIEDLEDGIDEEANHIKKIMTECGAVDIHMAKDTEERAKIWKARKGAFSAIGKLSPSYYTQDGVIPRSKLPEVLEGIEKISKKYKVMIGNVFHAGDGNLHPLILYNSRNEKEIEATHQAGAEILRLCVEHGGSLSGEHGIGLEKKHLMGTIFNNTDLENMKKVRESFNPDELLNPNKLLPTPGRCLETKMVQSKTGVQV